MQSPYSILLANPLASISYLFLLLSVISLWIPTPIRVWGIPLLIAIVLGLVSHIIEPIVILPIFTLALTCYYIERALRPSMTNALAAIVFIFIGYGFSQHLMPGIHNLKLSGDIHYLNFDKTLVGLLLLAYGQQLITTRQQWLSMLKQTWGWALLLILIMIALAMLLGVITFSPKITNAIYLWTINNLLFVCMAEEAIFRGFIQKHIAQGLNMINWPTWLAILPSSILFGLAHYHQGVTMVILATVAGLGYGFIYHRTKRIEASILTHFMLNLIRFTCFS